jgi:hypothetical protein
MIIWILHELCEMLRLYYHSIEISVGKPQAKLNRFRVGQMLVGLELAPCLFDDKLLSIWSRHLGRTPQKLSVERKCLASCSRCGSDWCHHHGDDEGVFCERKNKNSENVGREPGGSVARAESADPT